MAILGAARARREEHNRSTLYVGTGFHYIKVIMKTISKLQET
jgi:hypothetical protein